jgi:hypothetical protein
LQVAEAEAAAAARQGESAAKISDLTSKLEAAESSAAGVQLTHATLAEQPALRLCVVYQPLHVG